MNSVYKEGLFSDATLEIGEELSISDLLLIDKTCADALIRALCFIRKHTITDLASDVEDDAIEVVRDVNKLLRSIGHSRRQEAFDSGKRSVSLDEKRNPIVKMLVRESAEAEEPKRDVAPQLSPSQAYQLAMGVISHFSADKKNSFTAAEFDKKFRDIWLLGGQRDFHPADEKVVSSNITHWKSLASGARVKLRNNDTMTLRKTTGDYFITTTAFG